MDAATAQKLMALAVSMDKTIGAMLDPVELVPMIARNCCPRSLEYARSGKAPRQKPQGRQASVPVPRSEPRRRPRHGEIARLHRLNELQPTVSDPLFG